jgi:hypothetical protein
MWWWFDDWFRPSAAVAGWLCLHVDGFAAWAKFVKLMKVWTLYLVFKANTRRYL